MISFSLWFGSDVLFTIDHLRSISFFCQNAHHDRLTKEYISNWFQVYLIKKTKQNKTKKKHLEGFWAYSVTYSESAQCSLQFIGE